MVKDIARKLYLTGFIILVITLFNYQVLKGNYYLKRAKDNYVRIIPLRSVRGAIFDRNNFPVAYDKASFNIAVIPYHIRKKQESLFEEIAGYLNYDIKQINKTYKKKFLGIFSPVDIIPDIDKPTVLKLKEVFEDDILIHPQPERYYPYPYEYAHLLGYVKEANAFYEKLKQYGYNPMERVGFSGIEQYYDDYLRGEDGGDLIEVNSSGKTVGFLGEHKQEKGKDICLTIDHQIQVAAYEALQGKKGTIILMDCQQGEILAMASFPSYDANCFIKGSSVGNILSDENRPLLNRAIQATYPLGSTFKPILGFAALTEKKIKPSTTINCNGAMNMGGARFLCWNTHGQQDLYDALNHSCNVYFYNIGLICGVEIITKWAKKLGLGATTNIDLPYEKPGLVPTPAWKAVTLKKNWYGGDTVNLSIGQGFLQANPLQILLAINVFATDGYLVKPYILKSIDGVDYNVPVKICVTDDIENLHVIKTGLIGVVEKTDGTASSLKNLDLKIAGKTGTAQTNGEAHGWFVGFFPYNAPKYSICVLLENCGTSHKAVDIVYSFLENLKEKGLL